MNNGPKVLVLFSGGLDSTVALYDAISQYGKDNVVALSLYYGQRHQCELDAAEAIAKALHIQRIEKRIPQIFADMPDCSLLYGADTAVKDGTYEQQLAEDGVVNTFVPFRNGVFTSIAVAIAYAAKYSRVHIAIHKDDNNTAYPDCSVEFIKNMSAAVWEGTGHKIIVAAPFVNMTKTEIVARGKQLGMTLEDFNMTHSCYRGVKGGCGKCATCLDREKALRANFDY